MTSLLYVKRPADYLVGGQGRKGHLAEQVFALIAAIGSLFRLGLALLDHYLNELLPIPVSLTFWRKIVSGD
jgi:hypothetical protein